MQGWISFSIAASLAQGKQQCTSVTQKVAVHVFRIAYSEYNYGFSIFIKKGGVKHHVLPVVIDNCWMEGNASGSINSFTTGVNINGEIFTTPFDFHFEQCNAVKLQNTAMCRIKLIKSAVFAEAVSYAYQPGRVVEKDADSLFVEKTKFG